MEVDGGSWPDWWWPVRVYGSWGIVSLWWLVVLRRERKRGKKKISARERIEEMMGKKRKRKRFFSNPLLPSTCNKLHDLFIYSINHVIY